MVKGSHLLAKLELVGRWKDKERKKEKDAQSFKIVQKIHMILTHKP